jgi:hypothetical protein
LIVSTKAVSTLQELVAASGLMEHLLEAILSHDDLEGAGLQQINFDLLGELLKFNRRMFALLDSLLEGRRFDRFVEVRPQRPAASLSLSLSLPRQPCRASALLVCGCGRRRLAGALHALAA